MGKIAFFALLVLGGLMYYLKDKSLDTITKSKTELVKEGVLTRPGEGEFVPKWKFGDCIFENEKSWDYEKILFASKEEYKFVICRKFKGCTTEPKPYPAKAYEKDRPRFIALPCQ